MNARLRPLYLLAFAGLAAVVAGCSSGGLGGPVASGTDSASGQVACSLLVQQWAQTLWGLVTNQTGSGTPTFGKPTPNPDGSISQTFTGADGTIAVITGYPDGSVTLEITYPDGSTQSIKQSPPVFDGTSKTTTDWEVASSDGLTVTYTTVLDDKGTIFDMDDDSIKLDGTSVLPDKQTQDFGAFTENGRTTLESRQSDGSTFTMDCPLKKPSFILPDFAATTTGTYTNADLKIDYELDSTTAFPSRWAAISSDFRSGVTGRFALGPDFSGSGRLSEKTEAFAVLSWTQQGKTTLNYLSAGSGAASPAGAAVDYLTHRWQTFQALLAPAPGVSGMTGHIELPF